MRSRLEEFGGVRVVVVTFSAPDRVVEYQREKLDPLPVLVDRDRESYRDYGFGRGSVADVWAPKVWLAYARLLLAGRRLRRPVEDTLQLGGDVVVGADGTIAYVFRSEDPDDRPPVDELLAAVHRT